MWEKASNTVYDLLVGHEVGHALFTPDENWLKDVKVPPQFVNVVEDARIEKLMKRKYMGLAKTFFNGYRELNDEDFFSISDESVSTFNLADRANLYFKVGNFVDLEFTEDEQEIIDLIASTETFADVLIAAEVLYKFCKKKQEEKVSDITPPPQKSGESGSPANDLTEDQQDNPGEGLSGEDEEENEVTENQSASAPLTDEPEVQTADALADNLNELVNLDGQENVYVEIPQVDLKYIIAKNADVHREIDNWFNYQQNQVTFNMFEGADQEFVKFKRSAQKEVNYLVKEFECKKAADSYARATTARTGVLDCSKLHTYKYNEDLFKKVTTLADGKNHGLIFVLDWSGSMGTVLQDTLKQLFNLMWFCKKVNIPFEVYAFTNEYPKIVTNEDGKPEVKGYAYKKREGLIAVNEWFSMMNIFTSKTKMKDLEQQMKNFFRLAWSFTHWANIPIPTGLSLSGTPLNEAFISLHQLIPHFKKENKVQKVQCVVLSDGEAGGMKYHKEVQRRWEAEPFLGIGTLGCNSFLRNRKPGNTYSFDCDWWEMTEIFIRDIRDSFPEVNFIGIRLLESRDANSFIRRSCGWNSVKTEKTIKTWKKERAFALYDSGYHTYFALSANSLANDSEFDVDEGATKAKIKSAFAKSLKNKKMNKKVLGEFIELIA